VIRYLLAAGTRMNDSSPDPDQTAPDFVEQLVFRCLDSNDVEATADELCAEYPDAAKRLRRVLSRLASQGLVVDDPERTLSPLVGSVPEMEIPERLGDFRMISRLGAGGMGVVYLAEDETLGRQVAVKIVRPEQLYFPGARVRFQREIEAIARLQHPGIVTIHSVGEENGVPYFSMDYVRGVPLSRLIANLSGNNPARLKERDLHAELAKQSDADADSSADGSWIRVVISIVRDVADALEHAHVQGVIHRDVKPSNILIAEDCRPRLLDFGLARTEDSQQITRSTSHLGSLPYMAPEQLEGHADSQAPTLDVYALGVTMYELLTLRSPFLGATAEETRANILAAACRSPRSDNASISVDLETVCSTAMDPTPARRYQRMSAFITDLDNLLERRPIIARPAGRWLRGWRWCQRHPTATVGIGMAVVLFVLAVGFAMVQLENIRASEDRNYLLGIMAASSQLDHGRTLDANASLALCPEHLRRFEWNHLDLLANANEAEYRGHTGRVRWLDIHPGGEEFVSAAEDQTLRLWRMAEPTAVRTIKVGGETRHTIHCCVYSVDGEHIFACSTDGKIRRWNRDGSGETVFYTTSGSPVRRLAADPTGSWLACGHGNGRVQFLDPESGAARFDIAMSTYGDQPAPMGGKDTHPTQAIAFSADGRRMFVAQLNRIAVIDVAAHKQVATMLHKPNDVVTTLALSADGARLMSAGTFGRVCMWSLPTYERIGTSVSRVLGVNTGFIEAATNRVFVAGERGPIVVSDGRTLRRRYDLLGHEGTVTKMALAPDGRTILSASYDETIRRWRTDSSVAVRVIGRQEGVIRTLEITPDNRYAITGGKSGKLTMWEFGSGELRDISPNPGVGIVATSLSPDGRRLLVVAGGAFLVNLETAETAREIPTPGPLRHVTWLPDGDRFVGASRTMLWMFDGETGQVRAETTDLAADTKSRITAIVACPSNGRIVVGTSEGKIVILDANTLEVLHVVNAHRRFVSALAVDTDPRVVVSADFHGRIRFWNTDTGEPAGGGVTWKNQVISSVSYSPDRERMITSTMGRQIQVWDRQNMRRLILLNGHDMGVMKAMFTPDGTRVVSVSMDGTLRVWDSERRPR
jgi:serine/threonine protein kinase/WD40 repeat protein